MERVALRVWVPDEPGALAELAQRVAAAGGNVVGFEVLERAGDAAVDELLVELESAVMIDGLCTKVAAMDGTRIEEVRPVGPDTAEHGLAVIEAALTVLTTARPSAALSALVELSVALFDADWCALVDPLSHSYARRLGPVPDLEHLGSRPGPLSEMMSVPLEEAALTLWLGRPIPFRRRERREIEMLARVADRTFRSTRVDRIPPQWGSKGGFPGT